MFHLFELLVIELRFVDVAQSKAEGYMGKHGATVPSVRMITLF